MEPEKHPRRRLPLARRWVRIHRWIDAVYDFDERLHDRMQAHMQASRTVTIIVLARKAANNLDHTGNILVQGPAGQTMRIPYWVRFGDVRASLE